LWQHKRFDRAGCIGAKTAISVTAIGVTAYWRKNGDRRNDVSAWQRNDTRSAQRHASVTAQNATTHISRIRVDTAIGVTAYRRIGVKTAIDVTAYRRKHSDRRNGVSAYLQLRIPNTLRKSTACSLYCEDTHERYAHASPQHCLF